MTDALRRRDFLTLLGGAAAAVPVAARAQQVAMPVVGVLYSGSRDGYVHLVVAFRQGLKEAGFVEGQNVTVEYRWADGHYDRVPTLAADMVRRRVAVIVTSFYPELAAEAATTTIPTVFIVGDDPVKLGLVASLARPGGNLTGVNIFNVELGAKRLELLRALVPGAAHIALLVNPANATHVTTVRDVEAAARAMGLQLAVHKASTSGEIEAAFAALAQKQPDALFVAPDPFFLARRVQLVLLATRLGIPASYGAREFAEVGGLIAYGTSIADAYRQVGTAYVGRILKGIKPADLPVMQASKFELVINHPAARTLGLTVPPTLLAIADEVIE